MRSVSYYTVFIYIFPIEKQLKMHQKEENMTDNHTIAIVSEIHLQQSINEKKLKFVHE
jgi:hypothetical protein